jgi:hypothetical protein
LKRKYERDKINSFIIFIIEKVENDTEERISKISNFGDEK